MFDYSFIIIAYNEAKGIARCIDSILKQQNLGNYELIIVDDGSTDDTAKVVSKYVKENYRIKLRKLEKNCGRGAARAVGTSLATGKYFAFVDSDIILPDHWLATCLQYMDRYDAVSGIAVPDGDVNYIYMRFELTPKIIPQSTVVTGNNGLYKNEIFKTVIFNSTLKDGEDVAFNHLMKKNNFITYTINKLVVEHKELKNFAKSCRWLYQSGLGATRQLKQFKIIRLPDLVFFGFLTIIFFDIVIIVLSHNYFFLIVPFLFVVATSMMHVITRFVFIFHKIFDYIGAILVNSVLISCYFAGRAYGLLVSLPDLSQDR